MQVQAVVLTIMFCEYWVLLSSIMLMMWVIFGLMVLSPWGLQKAGFVAVGAWLEILRAEFEKVPGSVRVLYVGRGGGFVDQLEHLGAYAVRAFCAADIGGIGWGVGDSFHGLAPVVVLATNFPRLVTVARS
jgi:hypothetical protein